LWVQNIKINATLISKQNYLVYVNGQGTNLNVLDNRDSNILEQERNVRT